MTTVTMPIPDGWGFYVDEQSQEIRYPTNGGRGLWIMRKDTTFVLLGKLETGEIREFSMFTDLDRVVISRLISGVSIVDVQLLILEGKREKLAHRIKKLESAFKAKTKALEDELLGLNEGSKDQSPDGPTGDFNDIPDPQKDVLTWEKLFKASTPLTEAAKKRQNATDKFLEDLRGVW